MSLAPLELSTAVYEVDDFDCGKPPCCHAQAGLGYLGNWQVDAMHCVFLPEQAPADLLDARRLVERYEADSFEAIKGLACVVKIAILDPANVVQRCKRIRRFTEHQFAQHDMACIAILHQPWRLGVKADAHVHLIAPARELGRDNYGAFAACLRRMQALPRTTRHGPAGVDPMGRGYGSRSASIGSEGKPGGSLPRQCRNPQ